MENAHYRSTLSSGPSGSYINNNHAAGPAYPRLMDATNDDGNSANDEQQQQQPPPLTGDPSFDILEWHPAYQSCQRYFLDHAQHEPGTQALCALINIRLPFQYLDSPIAASTPPNNAQSAQSNANFAFNFSRPGGATLPSPNRSRAGSHQPAPTFVSLIPYIRRLIITGFDKPPILHGFFGDDYVRGVLPHLDCERRNYLFAAKHGGWRSCKKQYDTGSGMCGDESVPFMKPLDEAKMEELVAAEKAWSGWLAMEDWMIGPRAPVEGAEGGQMQAEGGGVSMSGTQNLPDGAEEAFRSN